MGIPNSHTNKCHSFRIVITSNVLEDAISLTHVNTMPMQQTIQGAAARGGVCSIHMVLACLGQMTFSRTIRNKHNRTRRAYTCVHLSCLRSFKNKYNEKSSNLKGLLYLGSSRQAQLSPLLFYGTLKKGVSSQGLYLTEPLNPGPSILDAGSWIQGHQFQMLAPGSCMLDLGSCIQDLGSRILRPD